MSFSRRDLSWFLPALAAAGAAGQQKGMPSRCFRYEDLVVKTNGDNRSRDVFKGATHSGFPIDMHETELAPGKAPHPPHHHVHEELLVLRDGTLEVMIAGKTTTVGPGGIVYVNSGEEHGWRNAGQTRARYYVMALGREEA
jgi:mannose-6-phosphate isomerase-like protein (cupin superfamily)